MKVQNPFPYTNDNKRYHTWNYHLRNEFGEKIFKVSLDAGSIVRTVTVQLLMAVVHFAVLLDLVTSLAIAAMML